MFFIQQVPPTPTPFSGGQDLPELNVPDSWFWDSAPETVGLWNSANQSGVLTTVQIFLIGLAIMLFIMLLLMVIRRLGDNG